MDEDISQLRQLLRELVSTETSKSGGLVTAMKNSSMGSPTIVINTTTTAINNSSGLNASQVTLDDFDQVSYTVRQVLQMGKENVMMEQLNSFLNRKDGEIEKTCSVHYQEFVDAVDQVLKLRIDASILKQSILDLKQNMNRAGSTIIHQKKDTVEFRRILVNIEYALETIQSCMSVLDICSKINNQIDSGKYYAAMKQLQELQDVHLRKLPPFQFTEQIKLSIPVLRERIKTFVLRDMKNWLATIKENSKSVGRQAMRNTAIKQERIKTKTKKHIKDNISVNSFVLLEIALAEENETELEDPQRKIDYKPLYQCIHIHDFVHKKDELKAEFEEMRKLQANLLLNANLYQAHSNPKILDDFLYEVAGFFIIEATVLDSTENFRSRGTVELLWDSVLDKIGELISGILKENPSAGFFLSLKQSVIEFAQTMEAYGYANSQLRDSISNLFDTFAELMKAQCTSKIFEVTEEDNFSPAILNNPQEAQAALAAFKFAEEKSLLSPKFPKQLACSKSFLQCSELLKELISNYYKFAEGFTQSNNEIDDLLKKALDSLLAQAVCSALTQKLDTEDIAQVCQVMVNLDHFELACTDFENVLHESIHKVVNIKLHAREVFKSAKSTSQKTAFELVAGMISEKLERANFDWNVNEPAPDRSAYAIDLQDYLLNEVWNSLAKLLPEYRTVLEKDIVEEFFAIINDWLSNPSLKRISHNAIIAFSRDMEGFIMFVEQTLKQNVPVLAKELYQVINYLKHENFEDILNPELRKLKYPNVKDSTVGIFLDKIKVEAGLFAKVTDKNKKKSIEHVLKTLKLTPPQ